MSRKNNIKQNLEKITLETQSTCPKHMVENTFQKKIFQGSKEKIDQLWDKLQKRETFIKGQMPPYRVEFATGKKEGTFIPGELNIHHGPFLSVHGAIGEISEHYRSLHYYYGSYVISFRLVRPVRLELFKKEGSIHVSLKSYAHPLFQPFWNLGNAFFWRSFSFFF